MTPRRFAPLALLLVPIAAACSPPTPPPAAPAPSASSAAAAAAPSMTPVAPHPGPAGGKGDGSGEHLAHARVYAPESLSGVFDAVKADFEAIRGSHLSAGYGPPADMVLLVKAGGEAGAFLCEGAATADLLEEGGLVEKDTRMTLATHAPKDGGAKVPLVMLILKGANRRSRELYEFLKSPAAWPAFEKAGFSKP